jgi:hypothetical protein
VFRAWVRKAARSPRTARAGGRLVTNLATFQATFHVHDRSLTTSAFLVTNWRISAAEQSLQRFGRYTSMWTRFVNTGDMSVPILHPTNSWADSCLASGFVKRLDGINLGGAPKRNGRCQGNNQQRAQRCYPKNNGVVSTDAEDQAAQPSRCSPASCEPYN